VSRKHKKIILEDLLITDYAAEGKALARLEASPDDPSGRGKVIFVSGAVPGDRAEVLLTKNKKDWAEGRVLKINEPSKERVVPFCKHFGVCGGCKWQMLPYEKQLEYKQQETEQNLRRIGKVDMPPIMPIIGADETRYYRNKLEFTFSNKRYLLPEEIASPNPSEGGAFEDPDNAGSPSDFSDSTAPPSVAGALGFHVPRIFDKVIDIEECYLMEEVNNRIRNTVRTYAVENNFSFYDIRQHTGWLRNLIIRLTTTGELMVNICLNYDEEADRKKLFDHLLKQVPEITTLLYTINPKWNDSIYDLTPQVYFGKGYATEKLGEFEFRISPKSFFQTNTKRYQGFCRPYRQ
jgi:23S rRNA (uracil1939-C5)-methyltransferase